MTGKDLLPWQGLTLACVRILQLYSRVFEQDFTNYLRIKEYVTYFYYRFNSLSLFTKLIECKNKYSLFEEHLNKCLCLHLVVVLHNQFEEFVAFFISRYFR